MTVAANVALICATVPVSVTVLVPLLVMVAVPPATVSVPWVTLSVTVSEPLCASTSAMLNPAIALLVSSLVVCAPGTVMVGASLTAVILTVLVTPTLVCAPTASLLASVTAQVMVRLVLTDVGSSLVLLKVMERSAVW